MKNLIKRLLREQLNNQDKALMNSLKDELKELEVEHNDILSRYDLLKKKIELLEYMENVPFKLHVYPNNYGKEYYQIRISVPFLPPPTKSPYYRFYLGSKEDIDKLSDSEIKERVKYRITQFIKEKLFPKVGL